MKRIILLFLLLSSEVLAGGGGQKNLQLEWSFDGKFGKFDRSAIQRGYQVYQEVCASCHSLDRVAYRNLEEVGFSEAEVKTIASMATIIDGPDEAGDMFERPGRPSDRFVAPYPNENAARSSNGGAFPPDLSLMVKARVDGANYVYSLLTGYDQAPEGFKLSDGMSYNKYFPGHQIAMPNPLSDGMVDYMDGTKASVEQMSKDLVNFLQWSAEPEMEDRNRMGIKIFLFLLVFTALFFVAKKRIWRDVE